MDRDDLTFAPHIKCQQIWVRVKMGVGFWSLSIQNWIHIEIANKMQQCIKIYYSMFGRHTTYHQELKTALAASGFAYVKGCWMLWLLDAGFCIRERLCGCCGYWTLSASCNHTIQQPFTYAKPEAASAVLSSWWWAACRPKQVELRVNME